MRVCTVASMRELDQRAIRELGIPEELLMENAGLAVTAAIQRERPVRGERFAVFCGSGNNGGDGLVVARKLNSLGAKVAVLLLSESARFRGASQRNWGILDRMGVPAEESTKPRAAAKALERCDAVVDAILGTGLGRQVEGGYREVIELINASGRTVYSVDIPSGIHGDTGAIMGTAVRAHTTVTFGLPKIGLLLYPGFDHCGRLFVSHISFPEALTEAEGLRTAVNDPLPLPERRPDAHKGSVGDMLVVAGAPSYYGAPCFTALSFLKAGGGYVRLAAPAAMIPAIAARANEIVFVPQRETESGALAPQNLDSLLTLAEEADFAAVGPGVSRDPDAQELIRRLAAGVQKPLILDGDGLAAVAGAPEVLARRTQPTILTPHPGEMARLLDRSIAQILANRVEAAVQAAAMYNACVVLKGAHSIIASPQGFVWINMSGNSGMATAGSGDVLTGAIGAMMGLGLEPEAAVRTGAYLHGLAGDLAADEIGADGITAQDIMQHLPAALKAFRADPAGLAADCCGAVFGI